MCIKIHVFAEELETESEMLMTEGMVVEMGTVVGMAKKGWIRSQT
jgi:hypothetical protein